MEEKRKNYNMVEKISFSIGVLVLLCLISFLFYQMINKKNAPPNLEITILPEPSINLYGFKVDVENLGDETAVAANIKLSLYQDGIPVEEGNVSIQYVPVKSKITSWIAFHKKKKPGDSVVVSSITYVKP